jgi:hypothetical protein
VLLAELDKRDSAYLPILSVVIVLLFDGFPSTIVFAIIPIIVDSP